MLTLTLLLCLAQIDTADIAFTQRFETPPRALERPGSMDFSKEGLFVLDHHNALVHQWDAAGRFIRTFGGPGNGPGELNRPHRLLVYKETLWIWCHDQKLHAFNLEGLYQSSVAAPGIMPRVFGMVGQDLALLNTRELYRGTMHMPLYLLNLANKDREKLEFFPSDAFLRLINAKNKNATIMKAYPPDVDIQRGPDGLLYYGFSQNAVIYGLDGQGAIVAQRKFDIPTGKPTEQERAQALAMSFPSPRGGRFSLKDYPQFKLDFDHDKAYYTHFLLRGGQIVFALTPLGTLSDVGNAYSSGSYRVYDFTTGAFIARGSYQFPEDSMVFYRNGRILGCILDEDDRYQVKEMLLRGMEGWPPAKIR